MNLRGDDRLFRFQRNLQTLQSAASGSDKIYYVNLSIPHSLDKKEGPRTLVDAPGLEGRKTQGESYRRPPLCPPPLLLLPELWLLPPPLLW